MNLSEIEEQAEEALEEVAEQETSGSSIEEPIRRIELANLYLAIIKADVFAPGSGSAETVAQANAEFRQFATERMNALLGITVAKPEPVSVVSDRFSDDEVLALKALAGRVLKKDTATIAGELKKPTLNTVGSEATAAPQVAVQTFQAPKPILNSQVAAQKAPAAKKPASPKKTAIPPKPDEDKMSVAPGTKTPKGKVRTATGYATPAGYNPNVTREQPINAPATPVAIGGNETKLKIPMQDLIQHAIGGSQQVTTLSDTIDGGDPNERI